MRTRHNEAGTLQPMHRLLLAVRWAIVAFVLVADWLVGFPSALVQRIPVLVSVSIIAAVALVLGMAANRWGWLRRPGLALVGDIILVTVVVYFSDGIQSPFYPLYYVTVIIAAVDFGLIGALVCAGAVTVISFGVDMTSPAIHATGKLIPEDLVRTVPFLFVTALITGALRDRVRVLDAAASTMQAQRAAVEREMEVAAAIQRAQLPLHTPAIKGVQITATYKPAREVGGDLYDFYPVEADRLGVTVADVSGKGVPAALLVSSCKYAVRESLSDDLIAMMRSINERLLAVTTEETFITMLYGSLDPSKREFRYVNAGHMPPIVVKGSSGETVCPERSDPPLAAIRHPDYAEQTIRLDPGDTLVLYTDGVTDALSGDGCGIEVFRELLTTIAQNKFDTWGDELIVRTENPHHLDDVTMVAIRMD